MSTQQAFNFEAVDHTRSRRTDPATSGEGERHIKPKLGKLKVAVLTCADAVPRTARELAELAKSRFGGEVESYRKRVRELEGDGILSEKTARTCQHTGRNATTYTKS